MEKPRIGIEGIESAAWGEQICVFFNTKDELLKLTVPYIKAGLEDNEFCTWIAGEPITVNDASHALEQALPNVHQYLARKQLEILPHSQCYFPTGTFDAQIVLQNWANRAAHAEAKGFAGTRITGNIFWLESEEVRRIPASGHSEHRTGNPHSEFVIFQAGLDVWHCQFEQFVLRVEEHTDVLTPRGAFDTLYSYGRLFHETHFT